MTSVKSRSFGILNFLRLIIRFLRLDILLSWFTQGKGYSNYFVKCLPQNFQYPKLSFRKARRNGILFNLDMSEYMEWVVYFGLNVEMHSELYALIRPGMVVFDIGTNFGETLLHFAGLVGDRGRVYGFEPVPTSYSKCIQNVSLNPFRNIHVEQVAISDRKETLFFEPSNNNNSGGISMSKSNLLGFSKVVSESLDDYVSDLNPPRLDFIKIDVEGFEVNVLKGAKEVLRIYRPQLFIEVDDSNLRRQGSSSKELFDLLNSYGYSIKTKIERPFSLDQDSHYDIHAVNDRLSI